MDILEFKGDYRFLSNMYKALFYIDRKLYISVEHWYQANKTLDHLIYETIRLCKNGMVAKRIGNSPEIELRPDWEEVKLDIMYTGVLNKFKQNDYIRKRLLATGYSKLIEGNYWHDQYWGVCNGVGNNHLGKILMKVREELRI